MFIFVILLRAIVSWIFVGGGMRGIARKEKTGKFRQRMRSVKNRESGQAALFALLLIPAAIAGVLLVFNTGQVTASKLKVQNAADAAAFSGMELQARQMNLDAYLNRAMLTNQIAIGQAVSILSWSRYAESAGKNIERPLIYIKMAAYAVDLIVPGFGPAVDRVLSAYEKLVKYSAKGLRVPGEAYANGFILLANGMDQIYSGASQVFNMTLAVSTPNGALQKTVEQVVRLNAGPDAQVLNYTAAGYAATVAPYWNARRGFVTTWGGSADPNGSDPGARARMASMINEGSQAFTVNRDHGVGFPLSFGLHIDLPPLLPTYRLGARVDTHKFGGSQFAQDERGNYVWSGADTVRSGVDLGGSCGGGWFSLPKPCWKNIYNESWGWGGSWSFPKFPEYSKFDYYDGVGKTWTDTVVNPGAEATAKALQSRSGQVYQGAWADFSGMRKVIQDYNKKLPLELYVPFGRGDYKGISPYRDLVWNDKNRPREDMTDSAPRYLVVVDLPVAKVRDSVTALGISHDPDASNPRLAWLNMHLQSKGAGHNEGVRAAAAAQIYFRRPHSLWPRSDGLDERANLFSPFWSARLVDLNTTEKAQVLALNTME